MARCITVGAAQLGPIARDESRAKVVERLIAHLREAKRRGCDLVVFPELALTTFFPRWFMTDAAEIDAWFETTMPGPDTRPLFDEAKRLGLAFKLGYAELVEEEGRRRHFNTAILVDKSGAIVGKYRKMHIPDDPRFYEKFYFTPGDLGFRSWPTDKACLGTLICWDQWYPEAARLTALKGAEILFYPTAIGWHPEEKDEVGAAQYQAWETIQRSHAVANGCFVVANNRTGFEPDPASDGGIEFWGQSFIAAPDGHIIHKAPQDEECVFVEELDLGAVSTMRHGWPFFRDRRIDAYEHLTRRFIDSEEGGL